MFPHRETGPGHPQVAGYLKTWFATMADSVMTETEVTSENRILVPEAISEEFDLTRVLLLGMEEWD